MFAYIFTSCQVKLLGHKHTMYQCKVDVDMLNTVKSVLAEVSSVSPSSKQRQRANSRNINQHTL